MKYSYVDVHCHPNLDGLKEDQNEVIQKMTKEGVLGIVVGVDLESSKEAVRLAQKHEHLYACVGLHPNYTQKETFDANVFRELVQKEKVVGIGECGIDYFRQSTNSAQEEAQEGWKEKQWEVFKQHVELALKYSVPLMIHCRPSKGSMDAYEEVAVYFEQLHADGVASVDTLRGNMHFFVGNLEMARRFWALGFTTSFTGVLTFAHDYDEVVKEAPLNMLLTETDAPYATPVPHRGKRNEPHYVQYVTQAIARIRGESEENIQSAIVQNTQRLFGIEIQP